MNYDLIQDLLALPKVAETHDHMHHNVRKHDHLMRSARYCYRLAPLLRADQRIAVRAAVLHDIDSRLGTLRTHGTLAASYAASIGEPNEVCRAIVSHMYPLGPAPTSREGWVLAIADKIATVTDITNFIRGLFTGTSMPLRRQLQSSDPFYRIQDKRQIRRREEKRRWRVAVRLHTTLVEGMFMLRSCTRSRAR